MRIDRTKITPKEFDIWMHILENVDNGVLWLLKSNKWAEKNLKTEAEARGISEEEEIESSSIPRTEVEPELESVETKPQLEELNEEWWGTDASVGELLLESDTEDIDLESLNTLADDLDEDEGSEDIDTSFIDEALDD